jgi:hypothetical protein
MFQGLFNGQTFAGNFYGSPEAIGQHIYPRGLNKYYDLYSISGFLQFLFEYCIAFLLSYFNIFGCIPLVTVWSVVTGKGLDNILNAFFEYIIPS